MPIKSSCFYFAGLQDVKNSSIRNLEKSFSEVANNNPIDDEFNPFLNKDQLQDPDSEILAVCRDETPTPPAADPGKKCIR